MNFDGSFVSPQSSLAKQNWATQTRLEGSTTLGDGGRLKQQPQLPSTSDLYDCGAALQLVKVQRPNPLKLLLAGQEIKLCSKCLFPPPPPMCGISNILLMLNLSPPTSPNARVPSQLGPGLAQTPTRCTSSFRSFLGQRQLDPDLGTLPQVDTPLACRTCTRRSRRWDSDAISDAPRTAIGNRTACLQCFLSPPSLGTQSMR